MVFSRITEIISAALSRLSAPRTFTMPQVSSGLLPQAGSAHGLNQKNNLRLSSSLQDLPSYHRLDPEEDKLNLGVDRNGNNKKQSSPLQRENGGSSFSKEKAFQKIPFLHKKWVRVGMLILCFFLFPFLIYVLSNLFSNWFNKASKFYVVLDCGSTGTRVYVYKASVSHKKDDNLPITVRSFPQLRDWKPSSQSGRAYDRTETEPGFDKLVRNVSGLKAAIKPLIRWAEKQIPKHSHKTTSLFLYATAGVRRLPSSDSEWLLTHAWSILKNSPFLCHREWVKAISGMEEGYYGWIALNYQTGTLGASAISMVPTFGALDLGGSSLQVTFESKEQVHNKTSLNLSIGSSNHHLSAYSLSGYGLNDAFDKSVAYLLKGFQKVNNEDFVNGNIQLKHPCLQSGYEDEYICSQCASVFQEAGSPLIGGKLLRKGGKKPGISVQLVGDPNWVQCRSLAKVAVNLSEWSDSSLGLDCDLQPCAISDSLPHPYGHFYAMSGFYVVYRFFDLTSEATLDDVLEKGQEFCGKPWEVAKNSVAPQPFIEHYCFRAPYIVLLLREGLHITDSQVIIGSGNITWTLGVALLESGKTLLTPMDLHRYEILQMKISPKILYTILFVSLLLLICALSYVCNWIPRFLRRPYLPLFRHNSVSSSSVLNIPYPFRFQRWSPISSGDGRVKMPLSPTVATGQQRAFGMGNGYGGSSIQLIESSLLYPSTSSVSHSYSSGSLGQMMQFDNSVMGSVWSPHRSQMRLQSRRSQSREDLNSSLAESHLVKV